MSLGLRSKKVASPQNLPPPPNPPPPPPPPPPQPPPPHITPPPPPPPLDHSISLQPAKSLFPWLVFLSEILTDEHHQSERLTLSFPLITWPSLQPTQRLFRLRNVPPFPPVLSLPPPGPKTFDSPLKKTLISRSLFYLAFSYGVFPFWLSRFGLFFFPHAGAGDVPLNQGLFLARVSPSLAHMAVRDLLPSALRCTELGPTVFFYYSFFFLFIPHFSCRRAYH